NKTDYGPVSLERTSAQATFCPLAASDPTHGVFAWHTSARAAWLKNSYLSGMNNPRAKWFVDVDGDGLPDTFNATRGDPSINLQEAQVVFTRQYRTGDPRAPGPGLPPRTGPALVPFDPRFSAAAPANSVVPAETFNPADHRFFYVDVNGMCLSTPTPDATKRMLLPRRCSLPALL